LHLRRSIDDGKKYWISRYPSKKISSHSHHCIIHRGALVSKELSSVFNEVMQVVIKVVKLVKSRDLKCRLFKDLCSIENENHSTFITLHGGEVAFTQ